MFYAVDSDNYPVRTHAVDAHEGAALIRSGEARELLPTVRLRADFCDASRRSGTLVRLPALGVSAGSAPFYNAALTGAICAPGSDN